MTFGGGGGGAFGGGFNSNHTSTNNNGRGRGRGGRGSSPGRGRGGRGGRNSGRGRGRGGGGYTIAQTALLRPCADFMKGNTNSTSNFAKVVQLFGNVDATTNLPNENDQNNYSTYNNYNQKASVTSIAIWENQGIRIFTGSTDGYWRLWNASNQFAKEFENNMKGAVKCVKVVKGFLFCGFEAVPKALPLVSTGMVHAWNLQAPTNPPTELEMHKLMPYAHNSIVTCITVDSSTATPVLVSGAHDGSIRLWKFQNNVFELSQSFVGHAADVTGLILIPQSDMLWSGSLDGTIRIWKASTGEIQHSITQEAKGHENSITSLLLFPSSAGTFLLSSSLDKKIKAWDTNTGACVHEEMHDSGVMCMTIGHSPQGNRPVLLIGMEDGSIWCRNLDQTPKVAAFALLFTLSSKYTAGHNGACRSIVSGPSNTFYTGGDDGKMLVFQLTGDLGLS